MSKRAIVITETDRSRLEQLLNSDFAKTVQPASQIAELRKELLRAKIVDPADVPPDVVTMNSTVRLRDLEMDEIDTYTLVYPEKADISRDLLSVLAPVGTAILGYRVGDVIRWAVPRGFRRLRIDEVVYQPEREGALHL